MARDALAPWADEMPNIGTRRTADDLAGLPEDGRGYELVEGRLVRMPPTGGWHGRASMSLGAALHAHVRQHALGVVLGAETGFLVSASGEPDTVLAPDAAFVAKERVPAPDSPEHLGFWRLAPDLVVEVASPSQYGPEMREKALRWLSAGVLAVWVVWPLARTVEVWRAGSAATPASTLGADDILHSDIPTLPGFSLPVAEIFA